MEDNADGLTLPTFAGKLGQDWDLHESNLKDWLFIRGIPLHSNEAARVLVLSLVDHAALAFHQNIPFDAPERLRFDLAVAWCRLVWTDPFRKQLASSALSNELNSRTFKQRGKRAETVLDLVNDLERLFLQAGIREDGHKRSLFGCAFVDFPELTAQLDSAGTYASALVIAFESERSNIRERRGGNRRNSRPAEEHAQRSTALTRISEQQDHHSTEGSGIHSSTLTSTDLDTRKKSIGVAIGTHSRATAAPASSSRDSASITDIRGDHGDSDDVVSPSLPYSLSREDLRGGSEPTSLHIVDASSSSSDRILPELSQFDDSTPAHSTPTPSHLSQLPRPPLSRPPLPSFELPLRTSFASPPRPKSQLSSYRRTQSVDLDRVPERILTPPFVSEATKPLFHPSRPATSQSLYSRAPIPPAGSPSPFSSSTPMIRPRSLLRKNAPPSRRSQHSRSISQPITPSNPTMSSTTTLKHHDDEDRRSTLGRSRSLLNSLFRRRRKDQISSSSSSSNNTTVLDTCEKPLSPRHSFHLPTQSTKFTTPHTGHNGYTISQEAVGPGSDRNGDTCVSEGDCSRTSGSSMGRAPKRRGGARAVESPRHVAKGGFVSNLAANRLSMDFL
ncbi:hypothetical protein JCM16303_003532 [Sporobolomyces ruberrimus]